MSFDGAKFGKDVVEAVKSYVDATFAPLRQRIEELEARGYKGVYEEGREYSKGQMVTRHGSIFHCNRTTRQRPAECDDWTLAVKAGRDGKDGSR